MRKTTDFLFTYNGDTFMIAIPKRPYELLVVYVRTYQKYALFRKLGKEFKLCVEDLDLTTLASWSSGGQSVCFADTQMCLPLIFPADVLKTIVH